MLDKLLAKGDCHLAESRGKLIGTSPYVGNFVIRRHVVVRCISKAALATGHRVQLPDVVHTQVVTVSGSVYLIAAMPWCVLALLTPEFLTTCPVSLAAEAVPTCGGSNIACITLVNSVTAGNSTLAPLAKLLQGAHVTTNPD